MIDLFISCLNAGITTSDLIAFSGLCLMACVVFARILGNKLLYNRPWFLITFSSPVEVFFSISILLVAVETTTTSLHLPFHLINFSIYGVSLQEPLLYPPYAVQFVASVVLLSSIVLMSYAYVSMAGSWRFGVDVKGSNSNSKKNDEDDEEGDSDERMTTSDVDSPLITTGAFGFSRNPIYVAGFLYILGEFLALWTPFLLIVVGYSAVGFYIQVLREERFLRMKYGREYDMYCRRVSRFLLF